MVYLKKEQEKKEEDENQLRELEKKNINMAYGKNTILDEEKLI